MTGRTLPKHPHSDGKPCPKCGEMMERDMVDVGIGEIPSGPWGCPNCGYFQIDALDLIEALRDPEVK